MIFLEKEMEDLIEDIVPSERLVELAKNLSPPLRQTEPTRTATAGIYYRHLSDDDWYIVDCSWGAHGNSHWNTSIEWEDGRKGRRVHWESS